MMRMKKFFALICGLLLCITMWAQQRTVSGTVSDQAGEALPGVNVVVKGTTVGTITSSEGTFTLQVPQNASTLTISFIGFITQEVDITNTSNVTVRMDPDVIGLEEVVAVGYGTQRKVNLTGSVETISAERIVRQPVVQTSQALVGLTPGLTAIQSSGQPGLDNATLRIRGIGSIGASNDPLVLIDGVSGNINNINPNDIADISVLKDAASASIYGSRASNGVILITTKRATKDRLTVNYRNYVGWQTPTGHPKVLNALDYLKYSGESQEKIDEYAANMDSNPDEYPDTDWINLLFSESGFQQNHSLSFNGGTEKIGILANIAYTDQDGNIPSYGYKRYNGRLNTDIKISEKFDVNFDISFHKSLRNNSTSPLSLVVQQVYRIPAVYPAVYSDGSWADGWAGRNPLARVKEGGYNDVNNNYFRGSLKANYSPVSGLKFSVMYTPEYNDTYNKEFINVHELVIDLVSRDTRKIPDKNSLSQSNGRSFNETFNTLVSYSKNINGHDFSALAGYEFIKYEYEYFSAYRDNFILPNYQVLNAGSEENDDNSGSATHSGLVSYFGRLNYGFKDKYLIEANIRRDASSRFSKANRVAYFPSFSVGWRMIEEGFIKDMNVFSNLKLRASWGQLGNQQIGSDFPYASSISLGSRNHVFGNSVYTGATQNVLANENIKWETTETTNFGIDVGFFDQHLSFTAEYYTRKTKDILLNLPIPLVIGLSAPPQNAGNVKNEGWDFSLTWQDELDDFNYSVNLNVSDVKNTVTNLAGIGPIISGSSITQVGSPIGSLFGYESIGMFPDDAAIANAPPQIGTLIPGNIQYKDQLTVDTNDDGIPDEADGRINADDRVILGNPFPRMTYGMNLDAGFKGFDLSVSLNGVGKRDVLLGGDYVWPLFNAGNIQEWHVKESWTPDNLNAKYPVISPTSSGSNDIQTSSTWVFDASYLRIRNITLGYTLPNVLLNKVSVENLRLYCSAQNLFTFDNLPEGIDPLAPNGTQGGLYPIVRNFIIGIDVNF
jgi:TonB-linked SusC/RagA family outer membrane protein